MTDIKTRKNKHMEVIDKSKSPSVFDDYKLHYFALPEIDFEQIDTNVEFLGSKISFPFLMSAMSGGVESGDSMNKTLAKACAKVRVPFTSGSIRIAIENPELLPEFDLKPLLQDVPYLLNIGAMQLKQDIFRERLTKVVESLSVDGLFIHINPLQEVVQNGGDKDWSGVLNAITDVVRNSSVSVFVKEVGHGLNGKIVEKLFKAGVRGIDVSGQGGLSWGEVEAGLESEYHLAELVSKLGYKTPELIFELSKKNPKWGLIAGGGIRSGLDIAKSLVLGARLATAASPFKQAAEKEGVDGVVNLLEAWKMQLRVAMFSMAATKIEQVVGNHGLLR